MSTLVGKDLKMRGLSNKELATLYFKHRANGLMQFDYLEFHPTEGGVNLIIDDEAGSDKGVSRELTKERTKVDAFSAEKVADELSKEPKGKDAPTDWAPPKDPKK